MNPQAPASPQTFFAPPERLSPGCIRQQAAALGNVAALLDCLPDFAMILNAQRQIIFANQALQAFAHERAGDRLLGLRPGELLYCREAAQAPSGCGTGEACRTCGAVNAILAALDGHKGTQECRIATTDIEAYDLSITASPFRLPSGDYALVIASDISDEKRRRVLERIFFHDILNTAGSLQGMTELIRSDASFMEMFKEDLHETAEVLVNEILSQRQLLAAERHELEVTLAPTNSIKQLDLVAQTYRSHELAKDKEIRLAPDSADFTFQSDLALLQRVLGNLVKNALEAGQPGDTVELGAEERPAHFVFWCHNRQHIPREVRLQLFQRSFSTKGPGRGLGTYSIRLLTERYLGGKVVLASEPETGTRFELLFPKP
ncbi:MAG: ATP-binding protein [Opitutaceae bacterium]|jgi:signal transduction histidine kinase